MAIDHSWTRSPSTTTHKDSLEVVKKMYEYFNKGDMDSIKRDIFASDLVWNLPGRHPLGGIKHGADEVLAFFAELNKTGVHVDLMGLDQFHEDTVVEVHRGHTQGKEINGVKLDALNCTHYHIVDGKIKDVQVYISDQYAVDDFFFAACQLKPIPDRLA